MNKILIIVAHPDDAEFGMGGTISKLSKDNNITLCVLCRGNRPGNLDVENARKKVLNENIKSLGITKLIQYYEMYYNLYFQNSIHHYQELKIHITI